MNSVSGIGTVLRVAFEAGDAALPQAFVDLLDRLTAASSGLAAPGVMSDGEFKAMLAAAIPRLRAFGRKLAGDTESGDDLAQDTVMKAWAARHRFQVGTNFESWTYTILRNHFLSQMRRKRFTGEWSDAVAETKLCAAADQDRNLHVQDVQRALDKLPAAQREALILVGAQELTYEEVAARCDVPLGTVKSRVARARAALVRMVEGDRKDEIAA